MADSLPSLTGDVAVHSLGFLSLQLGINELLGQVLEPQNKVDERWRDDVIQETSGDVSGNSAGSEQAMVLPNPFANAPSSTSNDEVRRSR